MKVVTKERKEVTSEVEDICCKPMEDMLLEKDITFDEVGDFCWGRFTIWYCPFCGKKMEHEETDV